MYSLAEAYDEAFFAENQREGLLHAAWFCPLLVEIFHPQSLVDVGCGTGHFGKWFLENRIHYLGIEGSECGYRHRLVDSVANLDLRTFKWTGDKYDLAISIEVAEHIEVEYAGVFVDTLCALSDTIVLTAAVPGQGGTFHVNEQPQSYWVDLFMDRNYYCSNVATKDLRRGIKRARLNNQHVAGWFKNIMVYRKWSA